MTHPSIFQDIERDREAGTEGWYLDGPLNEEPLTERMRDAEGFNICVFWGGYSAFEANARRSARTPDLEAITLASKDLADAVSYILSAAEERGGRIDCDLRAPAATDLKDALTAYRAAVAEAEGR